MATAELRKQLLEDLSARYAKIPAKLANDQKEEQKAQATAEVLADTLLKIQKDAKDEGEHIGVVDAMRRLTRIVKSFDFSESATRRDASDVDEGVLTPSTFVGRVESFRRAAKLRGESMDFAAAARHVLQHIP